MRRLWIAFSSVLIASFAVLIFTGVRIHQEAPPIPERVVAMILPSLLPVGLLQTWGSVDQGYWYARSPELMQTDVMQTLRWMRVLGDTVFAFGIGALAVFVVRLTMRRDHKTDVPAQ